MEMLNEINVVIMPANTIITEVSMDQEIVLTSKSHSLRNICCKALAAING